MLFFWEWWHIHCGSFGIFCLCVGSSSWRRVCSVLCMLPLFCPIFQGQHSRTTYAPHMLSGAWVVHFFNVFTRRKWFEARKFVRECGPCSIFPTFPSSTLFIISNVMFLLYLRCWVIELRERQCMYVLWYTLHIPCLFNSPLNVLFNFLNSVIWKSS